MLLVHYSNLLRRSMGTVVDLHPSGAELLLGFESVANLHWTDLSALNFNGMR